MSAKVISVANQKGGCGKTTLATNLAVMLNLSGEKTILIDADSQPSSQRWGARRGEREPLTVVRGMEDGENVIDIVNGLKGEYSHVIIDVGGRLQLRAVQAVMASDLTVIPVIPVTEDMASTSEFVKTILATVSATKPVQAAIVPNGFRGTVLHKQALEAFSTLGPAVLDSTMGYRTAYQEAYSSGLGVVEIEPKGVASNELATLFEEITNIKFDRRPVGA